MLTKLLFRPPSLSTIILCPNRFFLKPSSFKYNVLSLFSSYNSSLTLTLSESTSQTLAYGPSLLKGTKRIEQNQFQSSIDVLNPLKHEEDEDLDDVLNEESFTRVFDVAAIRVPSEMCFDLESRFRGHLLNWPRVRNIARVPGDEVDEEFVRLLGENRVNADAGGGDGLESLDRRMFGKTEGDGELLSPVLYREKLVKTFHSRGFVNFKNLAKISRPKMRSMRKDRVDGGVKGQKKIGKNDFAVVEVVEGDVEGEDLSGLLGDEFKGRKWKGSTRLLLLDERYASKCKEELPEAIKAVLNEDIGQSSTSSIELVRCKLTLFYSYWQMSQILEDLLPNDTIAPSAFETVGHIAHLNLRDEHLPYKKLIAKVVLDKNKPKIQTVVNKCDAIHNDYRTMQLEVLAGNHSLVTTVAENGLHFQIDLAKVYWNSRLATERQRLLSYFTSSDVVCDVFSGVGPIAISAARKVKHVYANDLNPHAVDYLERNSILNKLQRKIEVFNMDGRRFINAMFTSQKAHSITQVVMNLPNDATEYLDAFRGIYRKQIKDKLITLPRIHVYGFSKAPDPEFDFHERIRIAVSEVAFEVEMHRVRLVAPGKWMLCASFILPKSVAFSNHHQVTNYDSV